MALQNYYFRHTAADGEDCLVYTDRFGRIHLKRPGVDDEKVAECDVPSSEAEARRIVDAHFGAKTIRGYYE